jgi:hypothetical protein
VVEPSVIENGLAAIRIGVIVRDERHDAQALFEGVAEILRSTEIERSTLSLGLSRLRFFRRSSAVTPSSPAAAARSRSRLKRR